MTDSRHSTDRPTDKQMRLLRTLAMERGESFAIPHIKEQATTEIERLKGRRQTQRSDIRRERREISRDMATTRGDASAVMAHELSGYGSTAHWSTDPRPLLTVTHTNTDGTLVDGTAQGDGARTILRRHGFTWSPKRGRWQRTGAATEASLAPLIAALRVCGFEVELLIQS